MNEDLVFALMWCVLLSFWFGVLWYVGYRWARTTGEKECEYILLTIGLLLVVAVIVLGGCDLYFMLLRV